MAVVVGLVLLGAVPAGAHEVSLAVRVTLDPLPAALRGVDARLIVSVSEQLVVANPTATPLEVLDDAGVAFLRIGPDGVEANRNAAAWYLTNAPLGSASVPERARTPGAPEDWVPVAAEPSWGWFDHRLHPGRVAVPPEVAAAGLRAELARWRVPVRYGDVETALTGAIVFEPPRGRIEAVLDDGLDVEGLQVGVLPGRVPGLFLDNTGGHDVEVLGADGEPFLRIGPDGVEANLRSPSWAAASRARGAVPEEPLDPTAPPRWEAVADVPRYGWVEPRAAYPDPEPPEEILRQGVTVTLTRWTVPLRVDGDPVSLDGRTVWSPLASHDAGDAASPWAGLGVVAALGALAGLGALELRRRRTGPGGRAA